MGKAFAMSARSEIDERLLDEAIAWHHALEGDDADWDGYAQWLDADPLHREAYDEIALLDRQVDDHAGELQRLIRPPPALIEERRTHWTRRPWIYGSVAAVLAIAVGVPALQHAPADAVYMTGAGQTRTIAFANGASVELAPSTRLVAMGGDPGRLELAKGEAYFDVTHDPSRTLSIQAGDYKVTDIGTKFAMNLASEAVTVGVAEGNVSVAANEGEPTRVAAGEQLIARRADHSARKMTVASKDVGSWRHGRLVYNDAPIAVVAADLSRYSGKTVTVDPTLADREFSGVLVVGDGSKLFDTLSGLMAISYDQQGSAVRLVAAHTR
jgi:transmembrane sensor